MLKRNQNYCRATCRDNINFCNYKQSVLSSKRPNQYHIKKKSSTLFLFHLHKSFCLQKASGLCLFVSFTSTPLKTILLASTNMCNLTPSSSSSLLSSPKEKNNFSKLETCDADHPHYSDYTDDGSRDLNRWPTFLEVY